MTTMQEAVGVFRKAQAWDIRLGKMFGNADHVRLRGEDGISYAVNLAVRILIGGLTVPLMTLVLIAISFFNEPRLTLWAAIGVGVSSYLVIRWINPHSHILDVPLALVMGLSTIFGLAVMTNGVSLREAFYHPSFWDIIGHGLVALLVMYVLAFVGDQVALAFKDEPARPYRPRLSQLYRAGVLTSEEAEQVRTLNKWQDWRLAALVVFAVLGTVLLCIGMYQLITTPRTDEMDYTAIVNGLSIIVATVVTLTVIDYPRQKKSKPLKQAILARLLVEGVLKIESREITPAVPATYKESGFTLNGVFYPKGQQPKSDDERR